MSLNFYLSANREINVYDGNITHNLGKMATACGLYNCLWRPRENGYKKAIQIIHLLECGLKLLKENKEKYSSFNAENGWGMYEHFVPFVEGILKACWENPDAEISASV